MVYFAHDMPPHFLPTEATLDEVLFILGEPLCEEEVWAILLGGSIALIKYFDKSANAHHFHYLLPAINPDTLLLDINGTINFLTKKPDNVTEPRPVPLLNFEDKNFVSPENLCSEIRISKPKNGKIAIEKMFIYSLGMCMMTAARHCTDEALESLISLDLQACLTIMVEDSVANRITADSLKKVCLQHIDLKQSYVRITKLAKEILGSVESLSSSTSNLILPNPLDSLINSKKADKHLHVPQTWLKLPKPAEQIKKKGALFENKLLDTNHLILPASPKDKYLDEVSNKNLPPMHLQPLQVLSALSMSKTNESVDMTRAITSTPSPARDKNSKEVTMEFNGSLTATMMMTKEDFTINEENESSIGYLLEGSENVPSKSETILFETADNIIIDEKVLGLQSSGTESPVCSTDMSPSHLSALNNSLSPITTPAITSLSDGEKNDGIMAHNIPPVTPSPISPSVITQSQRSPSPITSDVDLNLTQSVGSSLPASPAHLPKPAFKEVNTLSSVEELPDVDNSAPIEDELPPRQDCFITNSRGIPNEERGSIEGRASPSLSPVPNDARGSLKSIPDVSNAPSPATQSARSSLISGRRHSSGSYGTVLSGRSNTISQTSLTQGAYSLDKGLDMEPEYPLLRFKSGGALSLCGVSSTSLPYAPSLDGSRKEIDFTLLGPEFVRVPSDPDKAFVDITPVRLGPLPKKVRLISVILLNAQEIQTQVQVSAKGKELFEQIATHIGLKETLYFGFALLQDGEHMFIDLGEKLTKYAPLGWKDEGNKKKTGEFVLHLKVKFFIEYPRSLKHKLTSHFYYLHLRKAIATGYTHCCDDSLLLRLAGYALQAEYGDFSSEFSGKEYFRLEHYLPLYLLKRLNHNDLYINLATIHQTLSGKTQYEAELGFLDEVKNVDEYEVLFHRVSRTKDNAADTVLLGICINGIVIKEHKRNQRKLVHEQCWDDIKKFYFEKKQFKLKPINPDASKMVFFTNHYRRSKYLFKMCQSFHRFQIFNQPISKQSMKLKKVQTQAMQSTFSDPLHNTVYSTLKGSEYSNYTFKSGEMKITGEIKFVPNQNEEVYSERSVDVLKNGSNPANDNGKKNDSITEENSSNTVQAQLQRAAAADQKDCILVNDVEIERRSSAHRSSPRSIYSDDGSLYTESELSTRNEPPMENSEVPMEQKNRHQCQGDELYKQYDAGDVSDMHPVNNDILSDGSRSSFSQPYSDYTEPSDH